MPAITSGVQALEQRRVDLKARLVAVADFRPGSLVERYRRCGKLSCHCAEEGASGHGPLWSLTHEVAGKTLTRVVPAEAVPRTREQIAEYRRFRGLVRELVETSEQLCDAKLTSAETQAVQKGGSRKRSRRRSSPRSKRS